MAAATNNVVVDLAWARARRAIKIFCANGKRAATDQLFAPAPLGLSIADAIALREVGWASNTATRNQVVVSLTPEGVDERDRHEPRRGPSPRGVA
jgi:hypothetical protein